MSQFRRDPISGRWVIVAPERSARPTDFPVERRSTKTAGFCPFCEGNEDRTPPEVDAIRPDGSKADAPGWKARVVPNRFPALRLEGRTEEYGDGLCRYMDGFGVHEVIIESPHHVLSLNELDEDHIREILFLYQRRMLRLRTDGRLQYIMLFKNVGASSGATVEHSHTQIIGMPVVPTAVRMELENARQFHHLVRDCIFCRMLKDELASKERIVHSGQEFVALAPFASRFPFETWILPRRHTTHFEEHDGAAFWELASVLRTVLNRLDAALKFPAFNFLLHTAPLTPGVQHYHWHLEIIPCITRVAGFEWGTGFYINPVLPESAAEFLRQAIKSQVTPGA